jgi:uncharacterized protein (DUF885 family)
MSDETTFYQRAEKWFVRFLEHSPVAATQLGDHRWDDRLGEFDPDAIERQYQENRAALAELQAMDPSSFRLEAQVDYQIILQIAKEMLRQFEKVQAHRRNPGTYLDEAMAGTFLLLMLEFAPLPQRLRSALGRVRHIPRVLDEGRSNLVPVEVPRVWAEVALEQAQQAPGLFLGLLPALAAEALPEIQTEVVEAGQAAAGAIQAYAAWLQEEVLPQAAGDFAAGRELFDELLRENHMVDYDADELLETGWQQLRATQAQMEALARQIDPHKTAREILEEAKADHPSAEGLLDAYRQAMADIRQYVLDHEIATIPAGESLRIEETPPYLRPIIPYAAYMPPGILEEKQEGIFLVTPVDPSAPPEVQEQQLQGHRLSKLPITALHEAYPGHHLQLVWANRQETIPRRLGIVSGHALYRRLGLLLRGAAGADGLHQRPDPAAGAALGPELAGGAHHPGRLAAYPGHASGGGRRFPGAGVPARAGQRPG